MFGKKSSIGAMYTIISIFLLSLILKGSSGADPFPITSPPEELKGTPGNGFATLDWKEPSVGSFSITHYFLYRTETGQPTVRIQVEAPDTTYTDDDVENGKDYMYYVTAENNIGESGTSNEISVRPDGDAPVVNIHTPVEGSISSDGIISVTWSGFDETSEISGYDIRMDQEGWIDKGQLEEHQFIDVVSGGHVIEVRGTDTADNHGFDRVNITVDLESPKVRITSPLEGQYVTDNYVNITWEAIDHETSVVSCEVKLNGYGTDYKSGPFFYNRTNIKDGNYLIEVVAFDLSGNEGAAMINITVDSNEPILLVKEPPDNSYTNSSRVDISWTGIDDGSGIEEFLVRVDDGDWISVGTKTSMTLVDPDEGPHMIDVKAVDRASLETVISRSILVDRTPPDLRILRPYQNESFGPSRVLFEWEGDDPGSGLKGYLYRMDGGRWLSTSEPRIEFESIPHGWHRFEISSEDNAGNIRSRSVDFEMDRRPPSVIAYGPFGSGVQRPDMLWVRFSEEMDPDRVTVTISDLTGDLKHTGPNYTWVPDRKFEFGRSYQVLILGYDIAGNLLEYFSWTFSITDEVVVTGRVYDNTGNPLANARIILDSGKTSVTDKDGMFNITARMGLRTLHVTKDGYKVSSVEIDLSPDRKGYAGNIYLEKEDARGGFKVPGFIFDPWTYIVLFLILIIAGLSVYLVKDRVRWVIDLVRRKKDG